MKKIMNRRRFNIISMLTIVVLLADLLVINITNKSYAASVSEKYDLRDDIVTLNIQNSQNNSLKTAITTQLETHIRLGKKKGKYSSYTEEQLAKFNEIESEIKYTVESIFPIYKETTSAGVKYYKNTNGAEATSDELKEYRGIIKKIIMEYGGVRASISKSGIKDGLNNSGKVCLSKDIVTAAGDQAVVIIGWDDNFSAENFPESCRPASNGAYLVQSSYGAEWGNNKGALYVSYEDIYIENNLTFVDKVEEPAEPTKPEEPAEPTKPEEPAEPTKPEEPAEPTKPEEPAEPTKPEEPAEPTKPEEPAEPTKPEEPAEPTKPEEPAEPTKPEEPAEPTKPEEPAEPTKPEEPAEPAEPAKPEETAQPTKPEGTAEPTKPQESDKPTETTKVETGNDKLEIDTSKMENKQANTASQINKEQSNPVSNSSVSGTQSENLQKNTVKNTTKNTTSGRLPQTGSNSEMLLLIAIAGVMFIAAIVHSLRDVIKK